MNTVRLKEIIEDILNLACNNPSGCDPEITDAQECAIAGENEYVDDIGYYNSSVIAKRAKHALYLLRDD